MTVYRGGIILKAHADELRAFWSSNGNRQSVSPQDWHDTISDLQRMGQIIIIYTSEKLTREKRRQQFEKVKNKRVKYFMGNKPCLACGGKAQARHHIIWLKNGGRNNKRNVCFLCNTCHAEVHPWLKNK